MFKNNKIKKNLAFSIISGGVLFCGTNAYAVKAPPNPSRNPINPLTVRKPVFSQKNLLQRMKSGDTRVLGPYVVVNNGGYLVDLREATNGTITTADVSTLIFFREIFKNTND